MLLILGGFDVFSNRGNGGSRCRTMARKVQKGMHHARIVWITDGDARRCKALGKLLTFIPQRIIRSGQDEGGRQVAEVVCE